MMPTKNAHGSVAKEIRQDSGFRSLRQEAAMALFRTADTLRRHFGRVLEEADITLQQYNVLRILRGAGPTGLQTLEIGARMLERTPGVTRLIDRLVRKGLVRRVRCEEDRRVVWCRLTPEGQDVVDGLDQAVDEADEAATGDLSDSEVKTLIRLLDRVRHHHGRLG